MDSPSAEESEDPAEESEDPAEESEDPAEESEDPAEELTNSFEAESSGELGGPLRGTWWVGEQISWDSWSCRTLRWDPWGPTTMTPGRASLS